jgi:hypothetical protein
MRWRSMSMTVSPFGPQHAAEAAIRQMHIADPGHQL